MEPVIEEMQEAAEAVAAGGEDDGLMLTAVGWLAGHWQALRAGRLRWLAGGERGGGLQRWGRTLMGDGLGYE